MQQTPQAPAQPSTPQSPQPSRAAAPAKAAARPVDAVANDPQLEALHLKRAEISSQLQALSVRRKELLEQSYQLRPEDRSSHTERIRTIDQRSARLERELFNTDDAVARQVTQVASGVQGVTPDAPRPVRTTSTEAQEFRQIRSDVRNAAEDAVIGTMMGMATAFLSAYLLWKGFRRFIWKRKPAPAVADQSAQVAQLQRSIDVIAVEVERISEAQRYVARVLNDRALGAGAAEPVHSSARSSVNAEPFDKR